MSSDVCSSAAVNSLAIIKLDTTTKQYKAKQPTRPVQRTRSKSIHQRNTRSKNGIYAIWSGHFCYYCTIRACNIQRSSCSEILLGISRKEVHSQYNYSIAWKNTWTEMLGKSELYQRGHYGKGNCYILPKKIL